MTTVTEERPAVETQAGGDNRYAHVVNKSKVAGAYIEGTPLEAVCGKVWVPSRDPKRFPVCPMCKELVEAAFGEGAVPGE